MGELEKYPHPLFPGRVINCVIDVGNKGELNLKAGSDGRREMSRGGILLGRDLSFSS